MYSTCGMACVVQPGHSLGVVLRVIDVVKDEEEA